MIWKCRDKNIVYGEKTLIMAIINITPDSFSDGGKYYDSEKAILGALKAQKQGADIVDFGAYSTRPGHEQIKEEEEWNRLEKTLKLAVKELSIPISVDTFTLSVAEAALDVGVDIINDVSGNIDEQMAKYVQKYKCGWIIMHNGEGGIKEVSEFFDETLYTIDAMGNNQEQICLDMGIGFGKTRQQDFELISNIPEYKKQGVPLLLGTSRKRVIGEGSKETDPAKRTYGNIAADTIAICGGADIIRLHDVENEKHGIYMADTLKKAINKRRED